MLNDLGLSSNLVLTNNQFRLDQSTHSIKHVISGCQLSSISQVVNPVQKCRNFNNGFLEIHEVTNPNLVRCFYRNLSCSFENVLTSFINGVNLIIDVLSNIFNIHDNSSSLYLNHYNSLYKINFGKTTIYQSVFCPLAIEMLVASKKTLSRISSQHTS